MLEVEDWTNPNKKRLSSKRISAEVQDGKEGSVTSPPKPSTSVLPPGPPEPDVEDTFMVTHPTNLHLFPSRGRSDSTPAARPSSLSRLLAQASPTPEKATDSITDKSSSPKPVVLEVLSTSPLCWHPVQQPIMSSLMVTPSPIVVATPISVPQLILLPFVPVLVLHDCPLLPGSP